MPLSFAHRPCRRPPYPDFARPRLYADDFLSLAPSLLDGSAAAEGNALVADWFSGIDFPVDLNDSMGDCGIAGMDHYQMAVSKFGTGSCKSWGDSTCQQLYEQLGGYVPGDPSTDRGTVLQSNLEFWRREPIAGSQILGFGALKPGSWLRPERIAALRAFGPLYLGLNLPASAEQQFPEPWTFVAGSPYAGGHCVIEAGELLGMDEGRAASWGAVVKMSARFMLATIEEAWVIIDQAGIERNGANQYGVDIKGMNEALAALTRQSNPLRLTTIL